MAARALARLTRMLVETAKPERAGAMARGCCGRLILYLALHDFAWLTHSWYAVSVGRRSRWSRMALGEHNIAELEILDGEARRQAVAAVGSFLYKTHQ